MPRRRFTIGLLLPLAVAATGGAALLVHQYLGDRRQPVPKPGPRRYPPGYRPPAG